MEGGYLAEGAGTLGGEVTWQRSHPRCQGGAFSESCVLPSCPCLQQPPASSPGAVPDAMSCSASLTPASPAAAATAETAGAAGAGAGGPSSSPAPSSPCPPTPTVAADRRCPCSCSASLRGACSIVQHTRSTCPSHCPSALPTPSPFHSSRSPFPIFPSRTLHHFSRLRICCGPSARRRVRVPQAHGGRRGAL